MTDRDRGWQAIRDAVRRVGDDGARVKVGVLADDSQGGLHTIDPRTGAASDLTVAETAVVNEFGTEDGRIPARPAHRATFDKRREEIAALSERLVQAVVVDQTMPLEQALGILGADHAAAVKRAIVEGVPPPNAAETIARKGSSTPLINTGHMINAITWAVDLGHKKE